MPSSAPRAPASATRSLHDALPICVVDSGGALGATEKPGDLVEAAAFPFTQQERCPLVVGQLAQRPLECGALGIEAHRLKVRFHSGRSEEHTSELQSLRHLVCRLLLHEHRRAPPVPYTTLFRSVWWTRAVLSAQPRSPAISWKLRPSHSRSRSAARWWWDSSRSARWSAAPSESKRTA